MNEICMKSSCKIVYCILIRQAKCIVIRKEYFRPLNIDSTNEHLKNSLMTVCAASVLRSFVIAHPLSRIQGVDPKLVMNDGDSLE